MIPSPHSKLALHRADKERNKSRQGIQWPCNDAGGRERNVHTVALCFRAMMPLFYLIVSHPQHYLLLHGQWASTALDNDDSLLIAVYLDALLRAFHRLISLPPRFPIQIALFTPGPPPPSLIHYPRSHCGANFHSAFPSIPLYYRVPTGVPSPVPCNPPYCFPQD